MEEKDKNQIKYAVIYSMIMDLYEEGAIDIAEIENIKRMFEEKENFITYRDEVVRCVVECIRVINKSTISIILKGGYTIEESLE